MVKAKIPIFGINSRCDTSVGNFAGGLPSRSDHERAIARPVAEDRKVGPPQVLRLRAGIGRPSVGEAGPAHLPGGLQAARRAAAHLHHGGGQAGNRYQGWDRSGAGRHGMDPTAERRRNFGPAGLHHRESYRVT